MPRQDVFLDYGPGRRLHAIVAGPAGARQRASTPDLVYFPGNSCSAEDMHLLIPRLAARWRFLGIDGPGREPVVWPDEEFDFFADMPRVMDWALARLGVGPHVAMGHSMGGMYALQHAHRHRDQVRALVLFEGFTTLPIHYKTAAPNGFRPVRMKYNVAIEFVKRLAANRYWEEARPRFKHTFWLSQHFHDARSWVAELGIPILVFIGDLGQSLPKMPAAWHRQLGMEGVKDLTVEVIPNAGHMMMLDDPRRVGDALMRFLRRVAAPRIGR